MWGEALLVGNIAASCRKSSYLSSCLFSWFWSSFSAGLGCPDLITSKPETWRYKLGSDGGLTQSCLFVKSKGSLNLSFKVTLGPGQRWLKIADPWWSSSCWQTCAPTCFKSCWHFLLAKLRSFFRLSHYCVMFSLVWLCTHFISPPTH